MSRTKTRQICSSDFVADFLCACTPSVPLVLPSHVITTLSVPFGHRATITSNAVSIRTRDEAHCFSRPSQPSLLFLSAPLLDGRDWTTA